jgi:hypothetical protein
LDLKKRKNDETTPDSKEAYEQSYGDAQAGGWAPRRRSEDLAERSHYSSQHDRQEDRSGFRRGWQGQEETTEWHRWGIHHARGDEDEADSGEEDAAEPAATESTAWVERRRAATRNRILKRTAKRKRILKRAAKSKGASARKPASSGRSARKKTRKKARKRRGE